MGKIVLPIAVPFMPGHFAAAGSGLGKRSQQELLQYVDAEFDSCWWSIPPSAAASGRRYLAADPDPVAVWCCLGLFGAVGDSC